jgi:charged multivesicular body protein 7
MFSSLFPPIYPTSPFPFCLLTNTRTYTDEQTRARLPSLYSDFRHLLTTNPDGYTANLSAWRKGLSSAAIAGVLPSLLTLSISPSLLQDLETKEWGRPLSLGTVVKEAEARREWMTLAEFEGRQESIYARSWPKIPGPLQVLGWGLRQIGLLGDDAKLVSGTLVLVENLEAAGQGVMKRFEGGLKGRVERIYSTAEFKEKFGDVLGKEMSDSDLVVLLRFLSRDKGVLVYDGSTIKFKATNETTMISISQEDATIASLKTLIKDLEIQTSVLEKRIDELNVTAKEAVARKNKVSALAALRSKKLAETTLIKRHATLTRLEEVFSKIEQAADQVELVRVMEGSTKVLSGMNKEVGDVERVDDVVDQLREQMSSVDEVGNVVNEIGQAGAVDEGEVDDELEAMEKVERDKVEEKERLAREEREKKQAEETKKRLDALAKVEDEIKVDANKRLERELTKSTEEIRKMTLDEALA